jgi:hypothetical protein
MKYLKKIKFNKVSKIILAFVFTLGLAGLIYAITLPTTPDLGAATTFGVLSDTYTANIGTTAITGSLGYTTLSNGSGVNYTVSGGTNLGSGGTYSTAGTDQGNDLITLNSYYPANCTKLGSGAVDLDSVALHTTGHYTPGCYWSDGAMNIAVNQTITLDGAGTYIFHAIGALTPKADTKVILNGASACDVFWTPTAATTIGAYTTTGSIAATPTFVGTIIDAAGITIGHFANLLGRALAFGGTVITDTNVITVPTCTLPHLTVTKVVVGGSKLATAFPLFVDGVSVTTDVAKEVSVGSHTVTETTDSNYTQTFSASCPGGIISLASGLDQTCTITNTYITPVSTSSSGGGGYSIIYGCKDPTATNYNAFSASKPELCIYDPTITILSTPVVVAPIVPKLPKTGFPPRGEGDSFFDFLFSNILNLFR